ncbi:patatin-like phospholipase family protein [Candidatus Dojkabacteria bacterium]|nr:patatin-like phospholipase family protein [Candidatus Dojkabacteria bacterium]
MTKSNRKQKKLALSLRGGGARCAAYLGALRAFEENDIKIDMITGASGGAITGGSYAAGKSIDEIIEHFKNIKYSKYIGLDSLKNISIASEDKSIEYAKELVGDMRIESTKIKFWPQVTRILTGDVEYLATGSLAESAVASSAAPGFMKPVTIKNKKYIDGDISGGFGAEFLRNNGADIVIGLAVGEFKFFENYDTTLDKLLLPFNIMLYRIKNLDLKLNPVDFLIDGMGLEYGFFDFKKAQEIAEHGYEMTMEKIPEIKALLF